jgi:site-specific DNA recombinase
MSTDEMLARVKATRAGAKKIDQGTATIYTRISQDKGGLGAGSERQLDECRALCESRGWTVVAEFDDPNISATKGKVRPAFEALLASQPERIVVWDVDRLLRSPKELERLIELGFTVHAVTQSNIGLDLESVNGRAMARIAVAMASQEGDHKAERVMLEAERRAAAGRPKWGRRPFGYNADQTIREDEANHVRQAYADLLKGASVSAIARGWNAEALTTTGGRPWSPVMVSEFLRSPRNAGILVFRGDEIGSGTWHGIVSEATFRAAQRVFAQPGRKTGGGGKRKYLLSGVATCAKCGGPVTGGTKGAGTEPHYRCTKDHFRVPVDYIDGLMWRALPQVLQDKQARAHWRHKVDVQGEQGGALSEEREALQGRLKDLADDYAKGLLDRAQLLSGTDQIRGRVREIDAELGAIGAASVSGDWWADVEYVIQELDRMRSEELRELIRLVCTDVVIHQRGRGRKDLRGDLLTVKAIGGKSYPKTK